MVTYLKSLCKWKAKQELQETAGRQTLVRAAKDKWKATSWRNIANRNRRNWWMPKVSLIIWEFSRIFLTFFFSFFFFSTVILCSSFLYSDSFSSFFISFLAIQTSSFLQSYLFASFFLSFFLLLFSTFQVIFVLVFLSFFFQVILRFFFFFNSFFLYLLSLSFLSAFNNTTTIYVLSSSLLSCSRRFGRCTLRSSSGDWNFDWILYFVRKEHGPVDKSVG